MMLKGKLQASSNHNSKKSGQSSHRAEPNTKQITLNLKNEKSIRLSYRNQSQQQDAKSNLYSKNNKNSQKCYSEVEVKSNKINQDKAINEDKKTVHNEKASNLAKQRIQQELQNQQKIRQGVVAKQSKLSVNGTSQKIKISGRTQKANKNTLEGDEQSNNLQKNQFDKGESNLRAQKIYSQIANQIKLNNLQSKVIQHQYIQRGQQLHKVNSSESQFISSPSINKQSEVKIQILQATNNRNPGQNYSLGLQSNKIVTTSKDIQRLAIDQDQLLQLNSSEERAMNASVNRQILQQGYASNQSHKYQQSKPNVMEYAQSELSSQAIRYNIQNVQSIKEQVKRPTQVRINKGAAHNLAMITNIFNMKVVQKNEEDVNQRQTFYDKQQELKVLRQAVRQLRLQNVKVKAEKEYLLGKTQNQLKFIKYQNNHESLQKVSRSRIKSASNQKVTLYGRISRNISSNKKRSDNSQLSQTLQSDISKQVRKMINPVNFDNLSTNHKEPMIRRYQQTNNWRDKKMSVDLSQLKQYKTMDLEQIDEEEFSDTRKNHNSTIENYKELNREEILKKNTITVRGNQIYSKLLDKFDANDKKFRKFVNRQQSKSRVKMQKNLQQKGQKINPQILKKNGETAQTLFQGSIIKNISKPLYESQQFLDLHSPQSTYINIKTLGLIKAGQNREISKRNINFSSNQIPYFPDPPSNDISVEQMMKLIEKILPYSDEIYNKDDLTGSSLKKYKNCIMFQLPDNKIFRLVWHFNGKLYLGQWDTATNQKTGQGIEYSKDKYYYKGEFSSGKRYGKGLMLYKNGNKYQGQFISGEKYGKGKYYDHQDNSYYEGEWKSNKMQGFGYFQFDQNLYEGHFKASLKHGFGIQKYNNGDIYIGQYANDHFHGDGKYIWANGSTYIGNFKQSFRDGFGKWTSSPQNAQIYSGFYTKDKKQGSGKYIWSNGCVYQGNFDNDIKHGIGSLQYPDGRCVEGVWIQGILTQVISKISETHVQAPLDERKQKNLRSKTAKRRIPEQSVES